MFRPQKKHSMVILITNGSHCQQSLFLGGVLAFYSPLAAPQLISLFCQLHTLTCLITNCDIFQSTWWGDNTLSQKPVQNICQESRVGFHFLQQNQKKNQSWKNINHSIKEGGMGDRWRMQIRRDMWDRKDRSDIWETSVRLCDYLWRTICCTFYTANISSCEFTSMFWMF